MLHRAVSLVALLASVGACAANPGVPAGAAPAIARPTLASALIVAHPAASADELGSSRAASCAARVGLERDHGLYPYAYAVFATEMTRLRDPGRGGFTVRRALDRVADLVASLPDPDDIGTAAAAERIRAEVGRLVDASPGQGDRARTARRALVEAHRVLVRLADGACHGDDALRHRITQLREAIVAIPDDPTLAHVSLVPILTALQRAQGAFLALAGADQRLERRQEREEREAALGLPPANPYRARIASGSDPLANRR